jgi:CspA family cold shock protein
VSNGLRHSRYPTAVESERLGKVLRGIAGQLDNQ